MNHSWIVERTSDIPLNYSRKILIIPIKFARKELLKAPIYCLKCLFCVFPGYTETLDENTELVVPDDDYGLYAIDILDPSAVSSLASLCAFICFFFQILCELFWLSVYLSYYIMGFKCFVSLSIDEKWGLWHTSLGLVHTGPILGLHILLAIWQFSLTIYDYGTHTKN